MSDYHLEEAEDDFKETKGFVNASRYGDTHVRAVKTKRA